MNAASGLVTFVGAGPGDPELLTIKGQKAIAEADLVLYAGKFVSPGVLGFAPTHAVKEDSALLTLKKKHDLMRSFAFAGKKTVRLHAGDPSVFEALGEEIALLESDGIPWRVIPGITAAMAAAAACGISFSIPEIAQTLILTRIAGRTPMPPKEDLRRLASLGASMAIYLSGQRTDRLQEDLLAVLPPHTPIICAVKVGWPQEQIIYCTLAELQDMASQFHLGQQTIFLILPGFDKNICSHLGRYSFEYQFRKGGDNGQAGN